MLLLQERSPGPDLRNDDAAPLARARLVRRMLHHLPRPGDWESPVPGLSFHRRDGTAGPMSVFYEPSLALVVQGRKRVLLGPRTLDYDTRRYALTAVDLPTIAQVLGASPASPFLAIMLRLDLRAVQEMVGEVDLHGLHGNGIGPGMALGSVTGELLDAVVRLTALADTPRDLPVMGRLVGREIAYHLLMGQAGTQLRQVATRGSQGCRIAGVIAWLREHHAEAVRVDTLAEMAAMAVSTFHHHFSTITRLSPLQYQKHIRLHEARRLLLSEPMDAATAAYRVGYESATQFSREYRRLFGNPPIRDIALLQAR